MPPATVAGVGDVTASYAAPLACAKFPAYVRPRIAPDGTHVADAIRFFAAQGSDAARAADRRSARRRACSTAGPRPMSCDRQQRRRASLASAVSQAGRGVIVLEEGEYHRASDFNQREGDMLPRLFPGRRRPADQRWCDHHPQRTWRRWIDDPQHQPVQACPDRDPRSLGTRARRRGLVSKRAGCRLCRHRVRARRHADRRGRGQCPQRADPPRGAGARLCGACCDTTGEAARARASASWAAPSMPKQNALKVLLPEVLARGARWLAECTPQRSSCSAGEPWRCAAMPFARRVSAGRVHHLGAGGGARGSAIGSAVLLDRSGLADPHHTAGRSLRLHPSLAVAGIFEQRVEAWRGIPQSFSAPRSCRFAPARPIAPGSSRPSPTRRLCWTVAGFGRGHAQAMRDYAHVAALAAMLHDETRGEVTADRHGRPASATRYHRPMRRRFSAGLKPLARCCLPPGPPGPSAARHAACREHAGRATSDRRASLSPLDPALTSVHPMGSLPLGRSPTLGGQSRGPPSPRRGTLCRRWQPVSHFNRRSAAAHDLCCGPQDRPPLLAELPA